jgi:hypothetical protein
MLADIRQGQSPGGSNEQLGAQLAFQLGNALGYHGRGDAEFPGGGRESAVLGHQEEGFYIQQGIHKVAFRCSKLLSCISLYPAVIHLYGIMN